MPLVELVWSNGERTERNGGCFGFTGRNGLHSGMIPAAPINSVDITNYIYHLSLCFRTRNPTVSEIIPDTLRDPTNCLKWLAEESMWAKYVNRLTIPNGLFSPRDRDSYVDIKTDIPGHAVIGTASVFRFVIRHNEDFIPFWNSATRLGINPMIAFLIYYAMSGQVKQLMRIPEYSDKTFKHSRNKQSFISNGPNKPTFMYECKQGLGDDEVLQLNNVLPSLLYEMIEGTAEFKNSNDFTSKEKYSKRKQYSQNILNSYKSSANSTQENNVTTRNFSDFILERFYKQLTFKEHLKVRNSFTIIDRRSKSRMYPMVDTMLLGIAGQLTHEYIAYGRFLGWKR